MSERSIIDKLTLYMDAQYPIIHLDTYEEGRAERILGEACRNYQIFEWNTAKGFVDFQSKENLDEGLNSLEMVLSYFNQIQKSDLNGKAIIIKDIQHYIKDFKIITKIKDLVHLIINGIDLKIFFIGPMRKFPIDIGEFVTIFELEPLTKEDIEKIINNFVREYEIEIIDKAFIKELAMLFQGLTEYEIENILSLAYTSYGEISSRIRPLVLNEKAKVVKKSDVLTMINHNTKFDEIGGLKNLKQWLLRKSIIYKQYDRAIEMGIDIPKGLCIVGMPGCGKSLTAKGASDLFKIPLLKFDMGKIIGASYAGESDDNMTKVIRYSERFSPCILWIDEIEKAFMELNSTAGGRKEAVVITSNFLTWMQEKESPVFVIATANKIDSLPPELLRKGRFDEVFFVDFPNEEERKEILEIHLKKRLRDISNLDLDLLAKSTEGFTGVSLESIVKDSMENAFIRGAELITTQDIMEVVEHNYPQREILKPEIKEKYDVFKGNNISPASKNI
ncbi:AAA+-type ATPase, SpoVK/Ycf46/Vps4 family [Hathewaya proteolytica DSM 3090]|uniref:Uncharacterized AAA domain-containing protein ycf46 n=1 Tax=Hathewaya proteolytica DSM 3090 TaxID=1121331 RepID=A0A1M6LI71_9CLOT|nr:AAA family ATPase [Hathewaya proteolytica]SHJ70888.1 AAA+-type ATPase, SpoVK/Ycf46/Vps4 family [Hathewaya proteolytica DSM 3090]